MRIFKFFVRLFRRSLCTHKWGIIEKLPIYSSYEKDSFGQRIVYGYTFVLQCIHCGNIKKKIIK